MWVARLTQRRRINQIDVTRDQCLEGALGLACGVFPHQCHVVIHHPLNKWTLEAKGDKKVLPFRPRAFRKALYRAKSDGENFWFTTMFSCVWVNTMPDSKPDFNCSIMAFICGRMAATASGVTGLFCIFKDCFIASSRAWSLESAFSTYFMRHWWMRKSFLPIQNVVATVPGLRMSGTLDKLIIALDTT